MSDTFSSTCQSKVTEKELKVVREKLCSHWGWSREDFEEPEDDADIRGYTDPDAIYELLSACHNEAIKVKFVIVDLAFWRQRPKLKWIVSHIIKTEGLVHSAIQVGHHLLHWFDSSLVYIKELVSHDALLALDVGALDPKQESDVSKLRQLARVVVKWNTSMYYNVMSCSCQHFVNEVLAALGMQKPIGGEIGKFVRRLAKGGASVMTYKGVTFTSHAQLDQYCHQHKTQLQGKEEDLALLKAFDRAFWLRYNRVKDLDSSIWNKDILKPDKCFFKDPRLTGTFPPEEDVSTLLLDRFAPPSRAQGPIRVLCMDGGGMRGVIMIEMLRQLEERTGKKFVDMFDLVAGTSSGGILAATLATKKADINGALQLYRSMGRQVFGSSFGNATRRAVRLAKGNGLYDANKLRAIIEAYVGKDHLSDLNSVMPKMFLMASRKMPGQKLTPYIFRSYPAPDNEEWFYDGSKHGKGIRLSEAMMATSAAPTYFSSVKISDCEFVDGGVVANNPTEIALWEARRIWPDHSIVVISLGTGYPMKNRVTSNAAATSSPKSLVASASKRRRPPSIPSSYQSAQPLFDIIDAATNSEYTHKKVESIVKTREGRKAFRYVRLNPPCQAYDLATCAEKDLDNMVAVTNEYLSRRPSPLDEALKLLADNGK